LPAIRPAAVAASFYPAAAELHREIGEHLGSVETAAVALAMPYTATRYLIS